MKHQLRQWYYRVCLFLGIYKREDFVTVSEVVMDAYRELYNCSYTEGLCCFLGEALRCKAEIVIDFDKIQRYIPKFTRQFVGAPKERWRCAYWWDTTNEEESRTVRLEALAKLYNYYVAHDELILKGKNIYFPQPKKNY